MMLKKILKSKIKNILNDETKLSLKLYIYFGIFILVALGIVGYITINSISNISISNARDTNISLIGQTAKNMDIVLNQIDKYIASLSTDNELCKLLKEYNTADKSAQIQIRNSINAILEKRIRSNSEFADAYIYSNNGQVYNCSGGISSNFFTSYPVKKFDKENKKSLWIDTYSSDHQDTKAVSVNVITLMKSMYLLTNLENVGTLMANVREGYLDSVLKDVKIGYKGSLFIIGSNNNVVLDPYKKHKVGRVLNHDFTSKINHDKSGIYNDVVNGKESMVIHSLVERTNWQVIGVIPIEGITTDIYIIIIKIILIIAFIVSCTFLFIGFLSHRINKMLKKMVTKRTEELEDAMMNLKKTQDQLVSSEKMAALGSLVAGVSHEVNTPLGISVTAATYLQDKTTELINKVATNNLRKMDMTDYCQKAQEMTKILTSNLSRAAELIRSFKRIAIDQSCGEKSLINLKEYLDEIMLNFKHDFKRKNINMQINNNMKNPNIKTYAGLIAQIFTNLIINSLIHGLENKTKGSINITLKDSDNKVIIIYSDNGVGMSEEISRKIFDPFYTTKRGKGGSGLGMYIVYNIVNNNLLGKIKCESELGKGTVFTIEFSA